jgi:hypothetical protein
MAKPQYSTHAAVRVCWTRYAYKMACFSTGKQGVCQNRNICIQEANAEYLSGPMILYIFSWAFLEPKMGLRSLFEFLKVLIKTHWVDL